MFLNFLFAAVQHHVTPMSLPQTLSHTCSFLDTSTQSPVDATNVYHRQTCALSQHKDENLAVAADSCSLPHLLFAFRVFSPSTSTLQTSSVLLPRFVHPSLSSCAGPPSLCGSPAGRCSMRIPTLAYNSMWCFNECSLVHLYRATSGFFRQCPKEIFEDFGIDGSNINDEFTTAGICEQAFLRQCQMACKGSAVPASSLPVARLDQGLYSPGILTELQVTFCPN